MRRHVSLIGGFAVPCDSLLIVFRDALTGLVYETKPVLRGQVSLISSPAEPGDRLPIIFGNSIAVLVHEPELVLRNGVPLLGSFAEPCGRLLIIFGNASALQIDVAESILRSGVALIGGFARPEDVFLIVLRNAVAVPKQPAETELRRHIVLVCSPAKLQNCRSQIMGSLIGAAELKQKTRIVRKLSESSFTCGNGESGIYFVKRNAHGLILRIEIRRGISVAIGDRRYLRKRGAAQKKLQNAEKRQAYRHYDVQETTTDHIFLGGSETTIRSAVNSIVMATDVAVRGHRKT